MQINKDPLEAFNKFIELTRDLPSILSRSSDVYFSILDSFIENPTRHRRHVKTITLAIFITEFSKIIRQVPTGNFALRMAKNMLNKKFSEFQKRYLEELNELRDKIKSPNKIQPCDLSFDILPPRLLETPIEWIEKYQGYLIEIRVAVYPEEEFIPESLSLRIEFLTDEEIKLLDSFPLTEFLNMGNYEIGLTNQGKFVNSHSKNSGLSIDIGKTPIKAAVNHRQIDKTEATLDQKYAYKFQYAPKAIKIISSAVKNIARWQLLRTSDQILEGGFTFYTSVLIPNELKEFSLDVNIELSFENWGPFSIKKKENINLNEIK